MKTLTGEDILWQNKAKSLLLSTHRLRLEKKRIFGSNIQSIMLEQLSGCELTTRFDWKMIRRAGFWFTILNGSIFLLNQVLFKAKLIQFLFGDLTISMNWVKLTFFISLIIVTWCITMFFLSMQKVFSFHTAGMTMEIELRWLSFDERESFISKVEQAKDNRMKLISTAK